jgi:hypothetical protein
VKARRVPKLDPSRTLAENAARIARLRLGELRSFAPDALEPSASTTQHDMRIAAKRLRYVLEVTGFCFGSPAERAQRSSRKLQDLLGAIHDCDVMLPRVAAHVERLRAEDLDAIRSRAGDADDLDPVATAAARNRPAYRGLETLALHLRARRELLFERFRAFWEREESRGTWRDLDRAAAGMLREARRRRKLERERRSATREPTEPAHPPLEPYPAS